MTSPESPVRFSASSLRRLGSASFAAAAVAGAVVVWGWYADKPALLHLLPGAVAMQFNTALCLLLTGAGGVAALRGRTVAASACAFAAAALAGVTFAQYLTGQDLLVDRLLWGLGVERAMAEHTRAMTSAPGRMAPATAVAFLLACGGVGALASRVSGAVRKRIAVNLGGACVGLALIAFQSYAAGATSAYAWTHMAQMAVHTAAGFVLLGGGIIAGALSGLREKGDVTAELPRLAALIGVMATLGLWNAVADQEERYIRGVVRLNTEAVANQLGSEVQQRVLTLVRLSASWSVRGRPPRLEWERQAEINLAHFPGYRAIAWIDSGSRVQWIVPMTGNARARGMSLSSEPVRRAALQEAITTGRPRMTPAVRLVTGGTGMLAFVPVRAPAGPDGAVVGVFQADSLIRTVLRAGAAPGYDVRVREGRTLLFGSGSGVGGGWSHEVPVSLHGVSWRVSASPRAGTLREMRSRAPLLSLLAGAAMTALLVWALRQSNAARQREREAFATSASLAREVEDRRRAEQVLAEQATELERSNRELEQFAYVASHDLQEPLRKIQAFSDLLGAEPADAISPDARDYVARMRASAVRMQTLIHDLLAFSRASRRQEPSVQVDLNVVAAEVLSDLDGRVRASGGTVEIAPLPRVRADATQMRQLLQNLIANALKFHRPGVPPRVVVEGGADAPENAAPFVHLRVRDEGIGFEPRYAERIFEPFQRLHGRDQYEGSGVGLAICRKIVERHGGTIVARGVPGVGSTFEVTLPGMAEQPVAEG